MVVSSSARRMVAAVAAVLALGAGCTSTDVRSDSKPSTSPTASAGPTTITFAVYGARPVLDAYRRIAARYTAKNPGTKVTVRTYATAAAATAARRIDRANGTAPDLFLTDRGDLAGLVEDEAVTPVNDLLAERKVDFGDSYARSGLQAFSADAALQCMPSDVSPLVVYYNPRLIDLDQVAEEGRNAVNQDLGWSLEEFGVAARQARRPGVRGLYVAPDLEQVAPFIWSQGGEVVDDEEEPSTLTLSDGPSTDALEQLLVLVRDPALTFNQSALQRRSALERFKAGRLGMLLGYRDLTPVLRASEGLTFDVMPLPTLSSGATIAESSGLCISADSKSTGEAADFLTEVISDGAAKLLARTGYVMPANLNAVNDDVFLQAGQQPLSAGVFGREVRDARFLPSTSRWPLVRRAAARDLTGLFYEPVILPLQDRLEAIDAASVAIFDPSKKPSQPASPTPEPSGSPTP